MGDGAGTFRTGFIYVHRARCGAIGVIAFAYLNEWMCFSDENTNLVRGRSKIILFNKRYACKNIPPGLDLQEV